MCASVCACVRACVRVRVIGTTQKHGRFVKVYCLSNANANDTGVGNM